MGPPPLQQIAQSSPTGSYPLWLVKLVARTPFILKKWVHLRLQRSRRFSEYPLWLLLLATAAAWRTFSQRLRRALPKFGGQEDVTATPRQLEPFAVGKKLVMSFARFHFQWTTEHIPGSVIEKWEAIGDTKADPVLAQTTSQIKPSEEFKELLTELRKNEEAHIDGMPEWVDEDLLQVGCDFFLATWPLALLSLSWALLGGFGAETASAVLVESRYWALKGEAGQRDSFQRLQETLAWLYDMCAHGARGFRPGGAAWESALYVRYLHARTRKFVAAKEKWDSQKTGLPINQAQLIGTLLGVSLLVLMGMEKTIGCAFSPRQREGFIHLWRVIGHLLGVDESLNPNKSFAHASVSLESVFAFAIPTFPDPGSTGMLSKHMCETFARGFREQYGINVAPERFVARARMYMGEAYCDAIGLPKVTWKHRLTARIFAFSMKLAYLPYILLPFPLVARYYSKAGYKTFQTAVKVVQFQHNKHGKKCRFGSMAQIGDSCPMMSKDGKMIGA